MSKDLKLSWDINSVNQTSQKINRVINPVPGETPPVLTEITSLNPTDTTYTDTDALVDDPTSILYQVVSVGVYRGEETRALSEIQGYVREPEIFLKGVCGNALEVEAPLNSIDVFIGGEKATPTTTEADRVVWNLTLTEETNAVSIGPYRSPTAFGATPPLAGFTIKSGLTEVTEWGNVGITETSKLTLGADIVTVPAAIPSELKTLDSLFKGSVKFNQDISGWDVSAVNSMAEMFSGATLFNQNLTPWCVTNVTAKPADFDLGSALVEANLPVWGTCPVVDYTLTIPEIEELMVGKTEQLTYTLTPEVTNIKTIVWSSEDNTIATVGTDGIVTGVAAGETTIHLLIDGFYRGSVPVTIVPEQIIVEPSNLTVSWFGEL